ncbi:MAG: SCO family protein [Xanthomonadales bacterium]|nr:SCO family protein [Xanthomonadales bacterium]
MTATNFKSPSVLFFIFSLVLLVAVIAYTLINPRPTGNTAPAELMGVLRPAPKPLTTFQLIDRKGEAFGLDNLRGKWTFVFFGFTFCPDVCPTTLSMLKAVNKHLENSGDSDNSQVLFVSVDPARDTAEILDKYIAYFNDDFLAATGSKEEIDNFTHQLAAGYIIEPETAPGEYQVAHTSAIFLIDPQASVVATFSQPHNPETIVQQYFQILDYLN